MANGIASTQVVVAAANAGGIGFFGSAGLSLDPGSNPPLRRCSTNFAVVHSASTSFTALTNPISNRTLRPTPPSRRRLRRSLGVPRSDASDRPLSGRRHRARCRWFGPRPNRLIAKVSRVEVAAKFLSPPPDAISASRFRGAITSQQAELARLIPMAEDITAEADSGGHTDNRPAIALIPTMLALRDRLQSQFKFATAPGIGAAGGISTPAPWQRLCAGRPTWLQDQ